MKLFNWCKMENGKTTIAELDITGLFVLGLIIGIFIGVLI